MKYQGRITDPKDLVTKEYVDTKLAPVETSPTASAHSTGDLLIHNGVLYKATADIAVGATLTVGTNIAATDLDEVASQLKSAINDKASIDLGITGASAGQIIKVLTVDGNGKPTAWSATEENKYSVIYDDTLTENVERIYFGGNGAVQNALYDGYTDFVMIVVGTPTASSFCRVFLVANGNQYIYWLDSQRSFDSTTLYGSAVWIKAVKSDSITYTCSTLVQAPRMITSSYSETPQAKVIVGWDGSIGQLVPWGAGTRIIIMARK